MCDIDKYKQQMDGYVAHLLFEVSEVDVQKQDEVLMYIITELIGGFERG